jgi:hypothetical protein
MARGGSGKRFSRVTSNDIARGPVPRRMEYRRTDEEHAEWKAQRKAARRQRQAAIKAAKEES